MTIPNTKGQTAQSNILRHPARGSTAPAGGAGRATRRVKPGPAAQRGAGSGFALRGLDQDLQERARHREWMAGEMEKALRDDRFVLHYQPQYEMGSGRIVGVEALVRMTLEDGSLVQPDRFIPIAEDNGFIVRLGHWILREACGQLGRWRAAGIRTLRMAVNVSPRQLSDRHLIDVIDDAVAEFDLAYGDLELEITEQCVFDYLPLARNVLEELHDRGLRIAIDDFGSGYSSFAYLAELPVDVFKLDRSFLTNVTTHGRTRQVVSAMIAIARELDLDIIAEGVETKQQYQFLQTTGCHLCQGFALARPAAADQIVELLRTAQVWVAADEAC